MCETPVRVDCLGFGDQGTVVGMDEEDDRTDAALTILDVLIGRRITQKQLAPALGKSENTVNRRVKSPDFPNAEECRLIAKHFKLNPLDFLVAFGHISPRDIEGFRGTDHFEVGRRGVILTAIPRNLRRPDTDPEGGGRGRARIEYDPDAPPP